MKALSFILLFLSLSFQTTGQSSKTDSLEQQLKTSEGEDLVDLLIELSYQYQSQDVSKALAYAKRSQAESLKMDYSTGFANSLRATGSVLAILAQYDSALYYLNEAEKLYSERSDKENLAKLYTEKGNLNYRRGEFDSALVYYKHSSEILEELDDCVGLNRIRSNIAAVNIHFEKYQEAVDLYRECIQTARECQGDPGTVARYYLNIGIAYSNLRDYENALNHLLIAVELNQQVQNNSGIATAYNSMGIIHMEQGDFDEALDYYRKSIQLFNRIGKDKEAGNILNNIGVIYSDLGNYDSALHYYNRSLEIKRTVADKDFIAQTLANIAEIHDDQKNFALALPLLTEANQLIKGRKNSWVRNLVSNKLASVYIGLGKYDSAEFYIQRSLENSGYFSSRNSYRLYSELKAAEGDYESSLKYYKKFIDIRDSLFNSDRNKEVAELQTQFKTREQKQELEFLNEQAMKEARYRNVLIGLVILVLLLGTILVYSQWRRSLKNKKLYESEHKLSEQLQEIDRMKSRFFANITHEIRTPLTLISGPVEDMLKSGEFDHNMLVLIRNNSTRLLKLINQLLDLSKIEAGKMDLRVSSFDLVSLVKGNVRAFSSLAEKRGIKLSFDTKEPMFEIYGDASKIEDSLINILSNAIKFTPESGRVSVLLNRGNHEAIIRIRDNGIGIHSDQLPYIFDRFYQADSGDNRKYQGTGIGLSLSKELIDLHHGKIEVVSAPGSGTEFTITLLLGRAHFQPEQIDPMQQFIATEKIHDSAELLVPTTENAQDKNPMILLVEDDPELQVYITSRLKNNFHVITASNGQEGIDLAREYIPDLIISDVMMPVMDGYELCEKIKNDSRTDHVPVILLTAKSDSADRMEGWEKKADDYMIKPFKSEELIVRINNLLEIRKNLRKATGEKIMVIPNNGQVETLEDRFMSKVSQVINLNLSNEQFSVGDLASEVALSKSQLNRKLQAIVGLSPNQFIRKYRLNTAKNMIENNQASISEISFQVGFSSPAYFTKCFHEEFGIAPKMVRPS